MLAAACQAPSSTGAPDASSAPLATVSGNAGQSPAPNSTPGGPDSAGVAAARAVIAATKLDDPATVAAIDAIRLTEDGVAAAAAALQAGVSGDALWAATYIYATSGLDPTVLAPALASTDPSIRAIGAAAALSLGDRAAGRILVGLLTEEGNLRGSIPPVGIAAFALGSLDRYVEGPTVDAGTPPADAAATWTTWLDAHESAMQYDPETGIWHP